MSFQPKRLAAVFFLPRRRELPGMDAVLKSAGASRITRFPPTPSSPIERWDCVWVGLSCEVLLREYANHWMLILYFRQGDFLEMMTEEEGPIPLEKDGALPLAQAFARACESLSPDVAFIVTHLDQASLEWIESRAQWVESGDADQLANERIGLLYLSEEMSRHWTSDPILDNRDEMHVKKGRLLFSGRDSSRWW